MTRKTKIIVSITGIVIVILILLGLTYAYYLTTINGNTNDKSINVSTANLELTYGDGNGKLINNNNDVIMPGFSDNKTFTVTNNGEDTFYGVIIEQVSIKDAITNQNTTFESNDFRYTLTCSSSDNNDCNQVTNQDIFPINGGLLITNNIKKNAVQTYTLSFYYIDTNKNQSNDMNKTYQARVNISNMSENPFDSDTLAYNILNNSLTKKNGTEFRIMPLTKPAEESSSFIYVKGNNPTSFTSSLSTATNNYISYADDYTVDPTTGDFTLENPTVATSKYTTDMANTLVGKYAVWSTSLPSISNTQNQKIIYKITTNVNDITTTIQYAAMYSSSNVLNKSSVLKKSTEKELSVTSDDYGNSYYFRGGVEDNYITFADMCWRIVRIQGDGSIKLILEDQDQPCSINIDGNWSIPTTTGGSIYSGNFGYTDYEKNTLVASDGIQKNSTIVQLMNYLHGQTNYEKSMAFAFKNFQNTFTNEELLKMKSGDWCFSDRGYSKTKITNNIYEYSLLNETEVLDSQVIGKEFFYGSAIRLNGDNKDGFYPTLKCDGTIMDNWEDKDNNGLFINTPMYIGAMTADEAVYAGSNFKSGEKSNYLINASNISNQNNFWLLSPYNLFVFRYVLNRSTVMSKGGLSMDFVQSEFALRPSISLISNVKIKDGSGTLNSPYTIILND